MGRIEEFALGNNKNNKIYWVEPSKHKFTEVNNNIKNEPSFKSEIRDEYVKTKRSNGIVRKIYDFSKNITGVGFGSKKLGQNVEKYEKGEITEEEIRKDINNYKISQENGLQTTADLGTGATVISSYYLLNNGLKNLRTKIRLNAIPRMLVSTYNYELKPLLKQLLKDEKYDKFEKIAKETLMSNKKSKIVLVPLMGLLGGITKQQLVQIERIGSKEYKADKDKTLSKKERKAQKKALNKERNRADRKAFLTGAVNGLLSPVTAIAGGIAGVPAYILGITGLNYLTNKNNDTKKSLNDFAQKFKDNGAINTLVIGALALPALKHAKFAKIFEKNLDIVEKNLKDVKLKTPDLHMKSAYEELEDKMFNSEKISKIFNNYEISDPEKITQLIDENIFAAKFIQIGNHGNLSKALQDDCPPSRTIEEAQKVINKLWGNNDYEVSKCIGVGTVAETYIAKDKSGKEVCIKILKEGINSEKIAKDKEKFVELIRKGRKIEELSEDEKYLLKNLDDLADGISKEVDFVNEMNAAKELPKYTNKAHVVKPIAAKDGIYIMEKAPGISVKTFAQYFECKDSLKWRTNLRDKCKEELAKLQKELEKLEPSSTEYQKQDNLIKWQKRELEGYEKNIAEAEQEMANIKAKSPDFKDFDIEYNHILKLCNDYIKVVTEQFNKLYRDGKVLHGDIHPGNIYVNLEALKTGRGKLFTLIDTGNTINLSKEQSIASLQLTKFVKNGNTKDLSKIALDGATLPKGMTKEQAFEKVEQEMRTIFLDNENKINQMTTDEFNKISNAIMRKYDITPNNTQLNLAKARTSAEKSLQNLMDSFISALQDKFNPEKIGQKDLSKTEKFKEIMKGIYISGKTMKLAGNFAYRPIMQESLNLLKLTPQELWQFFRNPNMLDTNSIEHLTYKIKQSMPLN